MNLQELLQTRDLEHSVLIGYYGGGNYGDELLLEVLANLLKARGVRQVTITHQNPGEYREFHHDFGYTLVAMGSKPGVLRAVLKNRNIIIGGGGLWGLDVNPNVFLLSLLLFVGRRLLGKNVYLLGVGYYGSTSRLGHVSAWLAGKAASYVIARDPETLRNFGKLNRHVSLDTDMAWQIPSIDLAPYKQDFAALQARLPVAKKTLFITLRRFKPGKTNGYAAVIEQCLADNADKPVIVALMEPRQVDPEGFWLAESWAAKYKNVRVTDFSYNPFALFLFFKAYHGKLALIGPQFHIIITAHLTGVPFLPVVYDNKVAELLKRIGPGRRAAIPIAKLGRPDIQAFVDDFYKKRA